MHLLNCKSYRLCQVLGIAARVFGVDIDPLTKKMDEVSKFMGRPMMEFNDCVSGVQTAAKSASAAASEVLSEDAHGAVVAQIEEFRDGPDSAAVSQIILPEALEGDALDQLISAVKDLDDDMRSNRQYINGLHCYTVRRPTAVLPDKVMWLCAHHKSLLEQWDASAITEEQLLARVEDPKAAAAASAASSTTSPAPRSASAPSTLQPSTPPPASAPFCFPASFPPELKTLSAQAVATHIKAIGKTYEQDSQTLVDEGYDGKMIGTFCGRADGDVLHVLEDIGIKSQQHRDRILVAFKDLFDPQTYPIQAAAGAQPFSAPVRINPPHLAAAQFISRVVSRAGSIPPLPRPWEPPHIPYRPCAPVARSQPDKRGAPLHEETSRIVFQQVA